MMARMLVIDPEAQAKVDMVREYATEHPSVVRDKKFLDGPPGDDPRHVAHLAVGYRCVYSLTHEKNRYFRDLSISVPVDGKFPSPFAAYSIAKMFGFTGWNEKTEDVPEGWVAIPMKEDNCIRILQEIK